MFYELMKISPVHFVITLLHSVRALMKGSGSYRPKIELLEISGFQNYSNLKTLLIRIMYSNSTLINNINLCYVFRCSHEKVVK